MLTYADSTVPEEEEATSSQSFAQASLMISEMAGAATGALEQVKCREYTGSLRPQSKVVA
jgi:hypothetical protein